MVQTQWRAGFFTVVGLDYLAVMRVAEIIGVELCESNIERIRALESEALKYMRE